MKVLLAFLICAAPASVLCAQAPAPGGLNVAQMPPPARLTFGMISGNAAFVRGAFAEGAKGSVMDATRRAPHSETREGPDAIAQIVSNLPSLTGEILNGKCQSGRPGKYACEYKIKRRNRQLMALIDVEGDFITSVIFTVTADRGRG